MSSNPIDQYDKLNSAVEADHIKLDAIREMSYDDLEVLCNQLLKWKLFVANREYIGEAIEQFMSKKVN